MSVVSFFAIFFVQFSSTFVDRMIIYFSPVQIYVWSRIAFMSRNSKFEIYINGSIISFYALMYFVWMMFSEYTWGNWIPYRINFLIF